MNVEKQSHPRVTVGLMLYNEEKYLAKTVETILEQGFSDFEILIADNASEDKTGEIALQLAEKYPHVRYYRHPKNYGAHYNYNFLVKHAHGEYFVLAGGHDLWSQNYLSALAKALDDNPGAVVAYAPTVWIDEVGNILPKRSAFIDTSGMDPVARFNIMIWMNQNSMYGMCRLDALRRTRLLLDTIGSDPVMLGELALQGDFIVVPEVTWFRRMNRTPESREERLRRYYRILFLKLKPIILPHWTIPPAYIVSILRGKMPLNMRIKLVFSALTSLIRYGSAMKDDVKLFFRRLRYKPEDSAPVKIKTENDPQ